MAQTLCEIQDNIADSDLSLDEKRRNKRDVFLAPLFDMNNIEIDALDADASFRRYYRIKNADKPCMLMQDPPDRPKIPPFVMVKPFVEIAQHLRSLGVSTPEIYETDLRNGLLLIEDFGSYTYTKLFDTGTELKPLYELAIDSLIHIHRHEKSTDIRLPFYNYSLLMEEATLLPDWYYPVLNKGEKIPDGARAEYCQIWKSLIDMLPPEPETIVLRDFHVDNLMYLPERAGVEACGVLDFQDAVLGTYSYDVMSLLEDARRDVPKDLYDGLYQRYIKGMGEGFDVESFNQSFQILSAQRHAKVVGIFVRLFMRDRREQYLDYLPHVQKLLLKSMEHPIMKPLKEWCEKWNIDLTKEITKNIKNS